MSIIVLTPPGSEGNEEIRAAVERATPAYTVETYNSVEEMIQRLLRTIDTYWIVVLLPASRKDLEELLPYEDILHRVRIVLILPDQSPQTVSLAHRLRPRVLLHDGDSLENLIAVMSRFKKVSA